MENKTLCRKVSSMLSLYIDNKVPYRYSAFIEDHLANCPECRKKYLYLKSLIKDLKSSYKLVLEAAKKKQEQKVFSIREHEKFLNQLYPYLDNELNTQECFEFRNYVAKSGSAQRELKFIYKIRKELKKSFDNKKHSLNRDFSRKILRIIRKTNNNKVFRIKETLLTPKAAKIAVLSGLVLLGGYETDLLYKEYQKPQTLQKPTIILQKEANRVSVKNNAVIKRTKQKTSSAVKKY